MIYNEFRPHKNMEIKEKSMKKFIVLYHASQDAAKKMASATPEEMKAGMAPWMEWAQKCGYGLVDMGTPLGALSWTLPRKERAWTRRLRCSKGIRTLIGLTVAKLKYTNHSPCLEWRSLQCKKTSAVFLYREI